MLMDVRGTINISGIQKLTKPNSGVNQTVICRAGGRERRERRWHLDLAEMMYGRPVLQQLFLTKRPLFSCAKFSPFF